MKLLLKGKLIEIGRKRNSPAMFARFDLTPHGQVICDVSEEETRRLAPMLYREIELQLTVDPLWVGDEKRPENCE